jgi:hypothetical protein
MLKDTLRCALALAVAAVGASGASAQSCAPHDVRSVRLKDQLNTIIHDAREPWPMLQDSLRVPTVPYEQVAIDTTAAVCTQAAQAYDREIQRLQGTPATARQIHLIRLGSSHYAASDPNHRVGEWATVILFTSDFVFVSAWTR